MKGLLNWWHCGPVYIRLYSWNSLFHCKTTIYDMIHKCGSDFIRDSDSSISTSSSIMSSSNTTTTYFYTSSNCFFTSMLLQFRVVEVLHSQKRKERKEANCSEIWTYCLEKKIFENSAKAIEKNLKLFIYIQFKNPSVTNNWAHMAASTTVAIQQLCSFSLSLSEVYQTPDSHYQTK